MEPSFPAAGDKGAVTAGKQSSSCSKRSAELSRGPAALHTRPNASTQKPVHGVIPKGPSAEEAENPGNGRREGTEQPLLLRQEWTLKIPRHTTEASRNV